MNENTPKTRTEEIKKMIFEGGMAQPIFNGREKNFNALFIVDRPLTLLKMSTDSFFIKIINAKISFKSVNPEEKYFFYFEHTQSKEKKKDIEVTELATFVDEKFGFNSINPKTKDGTMKFVIKNSTSVIDFCSLKLESLVGAKDPVKIKTKVGEFELEFGFSSPIDVQIEDLTEILNSEEYIDYLYHNTDTKRIKKLLLKQCYGYSNYGQLDYKKLERVGEIVRKTTAFFNQLIEDDPNNKTLVDSKLKGVTLFAKICDVMEAYKKHGKTKTSSHEKTKTSKYYAMTMKRSQIDFTRTIKNPIQKKKSDSPSITTKFGQTLKTIAGAKGKIEIKASLAQLKKPKMPEIKKRNWIEIVENLKAEKREKLAEICNSIVKTFVFKTPSETFSKLNKIKLPKVLLKEISKNNEAEATKYTYLNQSRIILYLNMFEKINLLLYFKKVGQQKKFSAPKENDKAVSKLKKMREKIRKRFSSKLKVTPWEEKLLFILILLDNFQNDKEFLVFLKKRFLILKEVSLRWLKKKSLTKSKRFDELLKEVYNSFVSRVKPKLTYIRMNFDQNASAIRTILKCLKTFEEINDMCVFDEKNRVGVKKIVEEWLRETTTIKLHNLKTRFEYQIRSSGTKLSGNLLEAAIIISICDEIEDDLKYYSKKIDKYFQDQISVRYLKIICGLLQKELFDIIINFISSVSIEQLQKMKKRDHKQNLLVGFDTSLEMFRELCPKFCDTWKHLIRYSKETGDYKFSFYGIFYQIIHNTITESTRVEILDLVKKTLEKENFQPISTTILHSYACKTALEICFGPLEMIYEIDSTTQEGDQPPKSLVFVYFEEVGKILRYYFSQLISKMKRGFSEESKRRIFGNNIQGSIQQMTQILTDKDTFEAIIELSSGGEFSLSPVNVTTLYEVPIFTKMKHHAHISRNEAACVIAREIFEKNFNLFKNTVVVGSKSSKKKALDEMFDLLNKKFVILSSCYYAGMLEKILEFLFIYYMNEIQKFMLDKKYNFYRLRRDIQEFVESLTDLLYCRGEGIKLQVLSHHTQRYNTLKTFFVKKDVDYLIKIYREVKDNKVKERNMSYFVNLVDLDDDDDDELNPQTILTVIKRIGSLLRNDKANKFYKNEINMELERQKIMKELEDKKKGKKGPVARTKKANILKRISSKIKKKLKKKSALKGLNF